QKNAISQQAPVSLASVFANEGEQLVGQRYRQLKVTGQYLEAAALYHDNRVNKGTVGYDVYSPFLTDTGSILMVKRGFTPKRTDFDVEYWNASGTTNEILAGRLNELPKQPPYWDERYPAREGQIWQYMPIDELALEYAQPVLPLMLELHPSMTEPGLVQYWAEVSDVWVAKHHAYALQWLVMAVVFFLACLIVHFRSGGNTNKAK
ncbi:MAG: SURF1 family protein, partial [Pseudomonadota bacterium]